MLDQVSLLTETEFIPVLATTGQRFLNYIIDTIIFYLIIVFVVAGLIIGSHNGDVTYDSDSPGMPLLYNLVFVIVYVLLYALSEILFKGRTIGKFITGTKAVNQDGTEIEPKTFFLRSLYRIVPFEAFSAFGGRPWHDKWTHTYVIDVKKTRLNDINQA